MSEKRVLVRRRRSRAEAEQLAAEFEASGLSRRDFCRNHELALGTLDRYRQQLRQAKDKTGRNTWVAVELRDDSLAADTGSGLVIELANGRRIEVGRGFDANTLEPLVRLLERA